MKTFITSFIVAVTVSGFFSCSSSKQTASQYGDDIYYSSKDVPERNPAAPATMPERVSSSQDVKTDTEDNQSEFEYYDENIVRKDGSEINNYYGDYNNYSSDDYYDYAYSSRIRRFHNPVGFGYYDPFYTNMYYYNYDPFFWGTSIYTSYNFWNPSPWSWGVGWGHGWGGYGWGGYGWGGGYYGWGYSGGWGNGWGYNRGYAHGYNHGYNHGYSNGLANNYYYNSLDKNSHHYGPRNSATGGGTAARSVNSQRSLGQMYQSAIVNEKSSVKTDVPRGNITGVNGTKPAGRNVTSSSPERGTVSTAPERSGKDSKASPSATVTPQRSGTNVQDPVQRSGALPARSGASSTSRAVNPRANDISSQTKPAVKPERSQNSSGNEYSAPERTPTNRSNVYNSPKRNPNTYQPQTPPNMNTNREMPNYNRQRSQGRQQVPNYNQDGNSSPGYNRGNNPTYSQPPRNYTPSNSRPSRSPGYSQPAPSRSGGHAQPAPSRSPGYSQPAPSKSPGYSQPAPSRSGGSMSSPSRSGGSPSSPSKSAGSSPAGRSPR